MKKQSMSTLGRRYCIAYKDEKLRGHNRIVKKIATLDILFLSNHNIHKSSCGLCFYASDPLIERDY